MDLVHIADHLCIHCGWGMGEDRHQYRLDSEACRRLGLAEDQIEDVIARVSEGVAELTEIFKGDGERRPVASG